MKAKQLNGAGRRTDEGRSRRSLRTQEERSARTRRLLIQAAVHVTREFGYSNLTIAKVAERAGLTNGAMQHHFPSREELVIAVIDAVYPVLEIPFGDFGSQGRTIQERVGAFIDLLWQIYSRPEYLVIWDIAFGTRGDAHLNARLNAYQRDISLRIRKQLAAAFADVGLTSRGADQIFSTVISCLRGFALQSVFGVDQQRSDLEYVKEIVCEGIERYAARSRQDKRAMSRFLKER